MKEVLRRPLPFLPEAAGEESSCGKNNRTFEISSAGSFREAVMELQPARIARGAVEQTEHSRRRP